MNRDEMHLPEDLLAFLQSGRRLEYDAEKCEAGRVVLKSIEQLTVSEVYVGSIESPSGEPNAEVSGYYAIPSVSLLAECDSSYDPEGILMWLPDYRVFGTWDDSHWEVLTFPGVSWPDIVTNPLLFLNAQWEREVECEELEPWERYEFKVGMPW